MWASWSPSRAPSRHPWLGSGSPPLVAALILSCQGSLFRIAVDEESSVEVGGETVLDEVLGGIGFDGFVGMNLMESEELENQGVAPGDIEQVFLVAFELEAAAPEGADLTFLDSLEVWVEAPGLPAQLLASKAFFPEGMAVVELDLYPVDLTEYLVGESMTLTTDVEGERPPEDTTVTARFTVEVGVTSQGACNQATRDPT